MKTIIEDKGKFAIKEVDEAGNSLGTGVERFDTKAEAQAFIDGADGEAPAPHGAEGDKPDTLNAPKAPEFVKHTVTQEDMELNPRLGSEMGINVGDEIELTEASPEVIAEAVKAYEAQKANDGQA